MNHESSHRRALRRVVGAALAVGALAACSASLPTTSDGSSTANGGGGATDPGAPGSGAASSGGGGATAPPSGGGGAASSSGGPGAGSPTAAHLAFSLVDAPNPTVTSIVVTIAKVEADLGSGWTTLFDTPTTIDLLTLQNGAALDFGTVAIPAGHVNGLRLILQDGGDQHVSTADGSTYDLTVPSGMTSGIKLTGSFDVPACATGKITMDFDGHKSIDAHPTGKGWIMRPVVRIKAVATQGTCPPDGGDADASSDPAGDADASAPFDPCAGVTCGDTELCENGTCRAAEPASP